MRLKYYLRGMGIGIIVTTVILMIVFSFHKGETLSDDEIRERAAALGMVMPETKEDSGKLSGQPTSPKQEEPAGTDTAGADAEPDTAADPGIDADTGTEDTDPGTDTEPAAKPDKTNGAAGDTSAQDDVQTVEQVEVSIVGGEYSDDVCKKLKRAGIIDDADDFNKYLAQGGYDSLIQPGTYVIPVDADYDTIVRMITEKKDKK